VFDIDALCVHEVYSIFCLRVLTCLLKISTSLHIKYAAVANPAELAYFLQDAQNSVKFLMLRTESRY
jgi:hypothetical protein